MIIVLLRWTLYPTAISRILLTSTVYGFTICFDCLLAPFGSIDIHVDKLALS